MIHLEQLITSGSETGIKKKYTISICRLRILCSAIPVPGAPVINLGVLSSPAMLVDALKMLPPIEQGKNESPNGGSQVSMSHGKFEEDEVLDAKAPIYSISLDKRLLQCGLTRHKAALEGWKKETETKYVVLVKLYFPVNSTYWIESICFFLFQGFAHFTKI